MFFSLYLLLGLAQASSLDLGPHLRVDEKAYHSLTLKDDELVVLITRQCSYCKIQLRELHCLAGHKVLILLDRSDEKDLKRMKIPSNIPVYLTTRKSRDLFGKNPVYPTGLIKKDQRINFLRGSHKCDTLKRILSS